VLGEKSFDTFFDEFSQNIIARQQQNIQNILWELNDYLMYLIVLLLL